MSQNITKDSNLQLDLQHQALIDAGTTPESIHTINGQWPTTLTTVKLDSSPKHLERFFKNSFELFIPTRSCKLIESTNRQNRMTFDYRTGFVAFSPNASDWSFKSDDAIEGASFVWESDTISHAAQHFFNDDMAALTWRQAFSDHAPAIAYLGLDIASQVTSEYPAGKAHVELLLESLLAMCLRRYACSVSRNTALVGLLSRQVLQAIGFIHSHLESDLSIKRICAESASSSAHLNRLFRTEVGSSVWQYVQKQRILKAAEQLVDTHYPAYQIYSNLKFSSRSNFIKQFKAEFGCTPTQYRQKRKQAA